MATGAARRWLSAYFGWRPSSSRLPAALQAWKDRHRVDRLPADRVPHAAVPFTVNRDDRTLTVRLLVEAGEDILVLRTRRVDPAPLEAQGLTSREAEVLGWVVEGKTSPEIAFILGLSIRTVDRYLEKIYRI